MAGGEVFLAAAAEHKDEPRYLEALGGRFELSTGPDALTWLELCAAGKQSVHSTEGAAAFLGVAKSCFTEDGWAEFRAAVRAAGIDEHDDIEELIGQALEVIAGRPTSPSSASDSGSSTTTTSPPSTESSSAETRPVAVSSA